MSGECESRITAYVHASYDDLGAKVQPSGAVVLTAGELSLWLELGHACNKATVLACLARWAELVEALPDPEGTP